MCTVWLFALCLFVQRFFFFCLIRCVYVSIDRYVYINVCYACHFWREKAAFATIATSITIVAVDKIFLEFYYINMDVTEYQRLYLCLYFYFSFIFVGCCFCIWIRIIFVLGLFCIVISFSTNSFYYFFLAPWECCLCRARVCLAAVLSMLVLVHR